MNDAGEPIDCAPAKPEYAKPTVEAAAIEAAAVKRFKAEVDTAAQRFDTARQKTLDNS